MTRPPRAVEPSNEGIGQCLGAALRHREAVGLTQGRQQPAVETTPGNVRAEISVQCHPPEQEPASFADEVLGTHPTGRHKPTTTASTRGEPIHSFSPTAPALSASIPSERGSAWTGDRHGTRPQGDVAPTDVRMSPFLGR